MDDFDLDYDDDLPRPGPTYTHISGTYIPGHLNSPIVRDDVDFILARDKVYCKRHRMLDTKLKNLETRHQAQALSIYQGKCHFYNCLDHYLKFGTGFNYPDADSLMDEILELASRSLAVHLKDYMGPFTLPGSIIEFVGKLRSKTVNYRPRLLQAYRFKLIAEKIKDTLCLTKIPTGNTLSLGDCLDCESDISFFYCSLHLQLNLLPTTLILNILDNLQSRFPLFLYWTLCDSVEKYTIPMFPIGEGLIDRFESLRNKYGERVFKILNNFEPLIVGWIVMDGEEDLGFTDLYETTVEAMVEDITLEEVRSLIPTNRGVAMTKIYLELLGIVKIFGHPCLDVLPGLEKVREHVLEYVPIDIEDVNAVKWTFIKTFCMNFYRQKHRWPKVKIESINPHLRFYFESNSKSVYMSNLPLSYWGSIIFEKNFDYDYSPNTAELIKDSAISLPRSLWSQNYDSCAFNRLYGKRKPYTYQQEERRAVLKYLKGTPDDLRLKMRELDEGYFDIEDNVAFLCRKERELNVKGRYFVKQTYRQRLAQTSSEKNISETIFKYMNGQTMTDSELTLTKKHCAAVSGLQGALEIVVLDFEKWNLKFRHGLVYAIGECLDQLFGLSGFYTNAHLWFPSCQVFSNSRLSPPDYDAQGNAIPGQFMHIDHLGGMEGMHQKKWTIVSECVAVYVSDQLALKTTVLCQGDNQVVMMRYTKDQVPEKQNIRKSFLERLSHMNERLNLKLKTKETWMSNRLFSYGKQYYYKGQAIPSSTKKISRLIPDINDGICSLMSSLSTINTVTESTAKGDINPAPAFFINQFEVLNFFYRKGIIECGNFDTTWNYKLSYLFFPSVMGGTNLSHYFSHCIRGHDDHLSMWLSTIRTCFSIYPDAIDPLSRLINLYPNLNIPASAVLDDIFAIRVPSIPSIENKFKDLSLEYLMTSGEVTNSEITELFNKDTSLDKDYLITKLLSMKPLYLSLAYELMRLSNYGLLLNARTRFTNIKTIEKTLQNDLELDFLSEMKKCNDETVETLRAKFHRQRSDSLMSLYERSDCPTNIAEYLRLTHWGLPLICSTRSYPIHQIELYNLDWVSPKMMNRSILIKTSRTLQESVRGFVNEYGPYSPYIGSSTKQKVRKPRIEVLDNSPLIKSVKQLVTFQTWFRKMEWPELVSFVSELLAEKRVEIGEEDVLDNPQDWAALVESGNPFHRLKSLVERDSAIINGLPVAATHMQFNTDYMTSFMKGGKDFTIFFQLIFLYCQSQILHQKMLGKKIHCSYIAYFDCQTCTKLLVDINISFNYKDIRLAKSQQPLFLEDVTFKPLPYSFEYLNKLVSFEAGQKFGKEFDSTNFQFTTSNTCSLDVEPYANTTNVSMTEFRVADFFYLALGMLDSSRVLRNYILRQHKSLINHEPSMYSLATALLHTNRLSEFYLLTDVSCYEHSQMTCPRSASRQVLTGISNITRELKPEVLRTFARYNFPPHESIKNSFINHLISKGRWVLNMRRKQMNKFQFDRLNRTLNYNLRDKDYLFSILGEVSGKKYHSYELPLDPEEAKVLWRYYYSSNADFKPSHSMMKKMQERKKPRTLLEKYIVALHEIDLQKVDATYSKILTSDPVEDCLAVYDIKNLHHLGRPLGNISSSCNKILEILIYLGVISDTVKNIYTLAEGSGSIALLFSRIYKSNIFFNTLMDHLIDPRIGKSTMPTSFLNGLPEDRSRLKGLELLTMGETNILEPEFIRKITGLFDMYNPDILTMDAESKEDTNNLIFLSTYIPMLGKYKFKFLIFKIFYHGQVLLALNKLLEDFDWILLKPLSSHIQNKEIFVVVTHKDSPLSHRLKLIEKKWMKVHISIVRSDKILINEGRFDSYLGALIDSQRSLLSIDHHLKLNLLYTDCWTQAMNDGIICSPFCVKLFDVTQKYLYNVPYGTTDHEVSWFSSACREKGTKYWRDELCKALTIAYMWNAKRYKSLFSKLKKIIFFSKYINQENQCQDLFESIFNSSLFTKSYFKRSYMECVCSEGEDEQKIRIYDVETQMALVRHSNLYGQNLLNRFELVKIEERSDDGTDLTQEQINELNAARKEFKTLIINPSWIRKKNNLTLDVVNPDLEVA